MLASVFVYGTLMPGHLRWPLLAPATTATQEATVPGRLYDTGQGWPAARFAAPLDVPALDRRDGGVGGRPLVPGWLVELAPSPLSALLDRLDEVEGVASGHYRRVRVLTTDRAQAWAYEAVATDPAWIPLDAWPGDDER